MSLLNGGNEVDFALLLLLGDEEEFLLLLLLLLGRVDDLAINSSLTWSSSVK